MSVRTYTKGAPSVSQSLISCFSIQVGTGGGGGGGVTGPTFSSVGHLPVLRDKHLGLLIDGGHQYTTVTIRATASLGRGGRVEVVLQRVQLSCSLRGEQHYYGLRRCTLSSDTDMHIHCTVRSCYTVLFHYSGVLYIDTFEG